MQMDLDSLIEHALAAHDLEPVGPARLEGRSGASYEVGLVARRGDQQVIVEVLWERPASAEDVATLTDILRDTDTAEAILCSVKGFTGTPAEAADIEFWDRAGLERAIGAHLLSAAIAEPVARRPTIPFPSSAPETAVDDESDAEILPGRAEARRLPEGTPEPASAAHGDDSDAQILPGRADRTVAAEPAEAPASVAAVDEGSDAEILPGRAAEEPVPAEPAKAPEPATAAPPDASGAEFLPGRAARPSVPEAEPEPPTPPKPAPDGPLPFPSSSPDTSTAEARPEPERPPPPAAAHPRPRGDGGFLAGRTIAPTVSQEDARRIAAGPLFATRKAVLELLPFHVFRYRAELEGSGTTRDASGHVWVSGLTGGCTEAPEVDLVSELDVPFERVPAQVPSGQAQPAVELYLRDRLAVREEVVRDHGEASIIERVTLRPRPGSVHLEPLGQAYVPRWKVEGQNGTVYVDATTGELLSA